MGSEKSVKRRVSARAGVQQQRPVDVQQQTLVPERVCDTCGRRYAGTAWHETGSCLLACGEELRALRAQVRGLGEELEAAKRAARRWKQGMWYYWVRPRSRPGSADT